MRPLHLNRIVVRLALMAGLLLAIGLLQGASVTSGVAFYTVDTTSDADISACTIAPNDCSLRGAINNANGTPDFEWIVFDLGAGYPEIDVGSIAPGGALPTITSPVVIDGSSGGATKIQLNGIFTSGADGLRITAGSSDVSGLVIYNFDGDGIELESGDGNVIQDNYIGITDDGQTAAGNGEEGIRINGSSANTIGGTSVALRNVISGNGLNGVSVVSASGNSIQGNYIGTDATGASAVPNGERGVDITGDSNTIGGTETDAGNLISGNDDSGVQIIGDSNIVQGNRIGTNAAATSALGNDLGIVVLGSGNVIGGAAAGARNIISGNQGNGVFLAAPGSANLIEGNYIGTDASGSMAIQNQSNGVFLNGPGNFVGGTSVGSGNLISGNGESGVKILNPDNFVLGNLIGTDASGLAPLANGSSGVWVFSSSNAIGGAGSGAANTIAFNSGAGIRVSSTIPLSTGNAFLSNAIHSNGGLGIDLDPLGVNPNDAGDGDLGDNNRQNFPDLTAAESGSTVIQGSFNSTPLTEFLIQFFRNSACDPSGQGEGEEFVGSTDVVTDASGNVALDVTLAPTVPAGEFITATATDPDGDTSEFSVCVEVAPALPSTPTPTPGQTPSPTPVGLTPTATPILGTTATPTPTPPAGAPVLTQGDNDCDGDSDSVDALKGLQHVAGIAFSREPGCPALGDALPVAAPAGAPPDLFGDIDCDDDVDSVDGLKILQSVAAITFSQNEPCANIGVRL